VSTYAEFVVVGAGMLGLSAARSLARRGHEVVVCEQGTVGHDASGSKGSARIFRLGYDQPGYVRLAMVALGMWRRLEAELETALVTTTGQVTFGHDLGVLTDAMDEAGAPYEAMTPAQVAGRFPALSVPTPGIIEPRSGVIAAADYLSALRDGPGLELRQRTSVVRLEDTGDSVRVVLASPEGADDVGNPEIRASVVVVCAGPWTAPIAPGGTGPYGQPSLEQVAYLAPADASSSVDALPVFVERRHPWFYGLPVVSSGVMKISLHGAGPAVSLDDLGRFAAVDRPDPFLLAELTSSARSLLPGLDPEPVTTERCVYDNSPDGDFVLERVGRVVVGAGTSGHGFKFAPLLGELLADLATGTPHHRDLGRPDDLERFTAGRLRRPGRGGGPPVHR